MLEQVSKRERLAVLKLEGLAQLAASPPQKFSWILEGWFGGWRLAVVLAVFFFFFTVERGGLYCFDQLEVVMARSSSFPFSLLSLFFFFFVSKGFRVVL
jgi:hypothetical protein